MTERLKCRLKTHIKLNTKSLTVNRSTGIFICHSIVQDIQVTRKMKPFLYLSVHEDFASTPGQFQQSLRLMPGKISLKYSFLLDMKDS